MYLQLIILIKLLINIIDEYNYIDNYKYYFAIIIMFMLV
jgi:hypothetical protein